MRDRKMMLAVCLGVICFIVVQGERAGVRAGSRSDIAERQFTAVLEAVLSGAIGEVELRAKMASLGCSLPKESRYSNSSGDYLILSYVRPNLVDSESRPAILAMVLSRYYLWLNVEFVNGKVNGGSVGRHYDLAL